MKTLIPILIGLLAGGCEKKSETVPKTISQKDERYLWEFRTAGSIISSPSLGLDGTVYVTANSHESLEPISYIYAIDSKTGEKKWEHAAQGGYFCGPGEMTSSPVIGLNNTVYVGLPGSYELMEGTQIHPPRFCALDGATGEKKWEHVVGGQIHSSPAIGPNGAVYFGCNDYKIYALNGKDGSKLWEFKTGGKVTASPAIGVDGTIYVGSNDGKVYALDGNSGTKKWDFITTGGGFLDKGISSSIAIDNGGKIYFGALNGKVYALDGKKGFEIWNFHTGSRIYSSPAIGREGTVYIASRENVFFALDGMTGTNKWQYNTGSWMMASPVIGSEGVVYISSPGVLELMGNNTLQPKLFALNGSSGGKLWEFLISGKTVVSSAVIDKNGALYVGSTDGVLYAINTDSKGISKSAWPMFGHDPQRTRRMKKRD